MSSRNHQRLFVFLLLPVIALFAGQGGARAESAVPVDLVVPLPPSPLDAGGSTHLFYELHLTNFRNPSLELRRLEILADSGGNIPTQSLAVYEGDALRSRVTRPGLPSNGSEAPDRLTISGGLRAVIFLDVAVKAGSATPKLLRHRLAFKANASEPGRTEDIVDGGMVAVAASSSLVLGPPLRGDRWLAANGPSNESEHRRSLIAVDGKARISQRYAIDWIRIGADGRATTADPSKNSNWVGYGAEALAVAPGRVVAVKDGIPENVPLSDQMAVPLTLDTIGGNYVILDLGSQRFALYAHLQPKSLRVQPGDVVRRGQVLGLVGNSGNSDAPHLHFQVGDANSPLGAEGLPYVLEAFELQGAVVSLDAFIGGRRWQPQTAVESRRLQLPFENMVVRFPEQ